DLALAQRSDSAGAWVEVCDGWRRLGHVRNLGAAAYRLAGALLREGDKPGASTALTEAWEIAARMGAGPLRDSAVRLSRRARVPIKPSDGRGVESGRAAGRLAQLTDRELEVLRHVASGKSNAEIATTLFMSPKTVSVHVSHILAKLDATSRTQATAVAL